MANQKTFSEVVVVEAVSANKKGIKANGQWLNFSAKAGFDGSAFVKGQAYSVSGQLGQDGHKFISAMSQHTPGQAPLPAAPASAPAAPPPPVAAPVAPPAAPPAAGVLPDAAVPTKYGRPISAYEVKEGVRIGVQGIVQAVAASPFLPLLVRDGVTFSSLVETESRALLGLCDKLTEERAK